MDKGKIAEWFISLVMARGQAAAVVGDLLEAGASRGAGWFWSNVMRTWIASVWRDGKSQPRFVLGMAALGILVHWGISFAGGLLFVFTTEIIRSTLSPPLSIPGEVLLAFIQQLTAALAGSFYAGQWIARFSLGREIAVCVAMGLVAPILFYGLGVLCWCFLTLLRIHAPPLAFMGWSGWMPVFFGAYLLGAVLARRRRQIAGAV